MLFHSCINRGHHRNRTRHPFEIQFNFINAAACFNEEAERLFFKKKKKSRQLHASNLIFKILTTIYFILII